MDENGPTPSRAIGLRVRREGDAVDAGQRSERGFPGPANVHRGPDPPTILASVACALLVAMNTLALSDAALALAALTLAYRRRDRSALLLGAAVLAVASGLGVLRFSGLFPLPDAHRAASLLAGGVSVPLIVADAALVPLPPLGSRRGAFLVGALAAVSLVSFAVAPLSILQRLVSVGSVVALLVVAARRRDGRALVVASLLFMAFGAFAAKWSAGPLQPGDLLHIGMAFAVALVAARR